MSGASYHSGSNSSYGISTVRDNGVISMAGSGEDEEYGDNLSVKKMAASPKAVAYGDEEQEMEHVQQANQVNSLCADLNYFMCCCIPTKAKGPGDVAGRLGKWFFGQSDQFISSIIGK